MLDKTFISRKIELIQQDLLRLTEFIVHGYNRIDKSLVFQTVGVAIGQYTRYCGYIQKFLQKQKK